MLNEIEEYRAIALRPYPVVETCTDPHWSARYHAMEQTLKKNNSLTGISRPMLLVARRFLYETSLYRKDTTWQERYLAARYALCAWCGFPVKAGAQEDHLADLSAKGEEELKLLNSWFTNALQVMEQGDRKKTMSDKWAKQKKQYQKDVSPSFFDMREAERNPSLLPRRMNQIAAMMPKANEITLERILAAASDAGPLRNCCLVVKNDFRSVLYNVTGKATEKMYRGSAVNSNYQARANQVFHLIAMILMCSNGDYYDCVTSLESASDKEPKPEKKNREAHFAPIVQADFGNWVGAGRPDKYFSQIVRGIYWMDGETPHEVFQKKETGSNKYWLRLNPAFQQTFGISLVPADAPLEEEGRRYRDQDLFVTSEQEPAPAKVQMGKQQRKNHR